jgi:hypothetical protein
LVNEKTLNFEARRNLPTFETSFEVKLESWISFKPFITLTLDKPKVTVQRSASDVLEEGKGSISITCLSEANPPAR